MTTRKIETFLAAVILMIIYTASSQARIINVNASNNVFTPQTISVVVGDTVQWTRTQGSQPLPVMDRNLHPGPRVQIHGMLP